MLFYRSCHELLSNFEIIHFFLKSKKCWDEIWQFQDWNVDLVSDPFATRQTWKWNSLLHFKYLTMKSRKQQCLPNDFADMFFSCCVRIKMTIYYLQGQQAYWKVSIQQGVKALDCFPVNDWFMSHDLPLTTVGCPFLYNFMGKGGNVLLFVWYGLFTLKFSLEWFLAE